MSRPRIAWFCTYTPLEILDAAGLVPYGIREDSGKGHEDVILGDAACSFVRSCLGAKLSGAYDRFQGAVIAHSCECMRRLFDAWSHGVEAGDGQWVHLLDVPRKKDMKSASFFAANIKRFQDAVKRRFGDYPEERLVEAIGRRDALWEMLEEIRRSRMSDPPGIRGSEFARLLHVVLTRPPEESLEKLEEVRIEVTAEKGERRGPRLMIYGGPISVHIHELIESAGGEVVLEHACNGMRFGRGKVDLEGDPLRALAEAYLAKPPCPRMLGGRAASGMDELRSLVREYRLDGVIYCAMKFCSNLQGQWPLFRERAAWGVPVKIAESDISGKVDPREIEAFVKRLRRRKVS